MIQYRYRIFCESEVFEMAKRKNSDGKKATKTKEKKATNGNGNSNESPRCVLTLALLTEPWQEHILKKRFDIIERLKNQLIAKELKRFENVRRTKKYREIEAELNVTSNEDRKNELYNEREKILVAAGFPKKPSKNRKSGKVILTKCFTDDMTKMQKHFVEHITAQISHKAAEDVSRAFEKFLYSSSNEIHYQKRGTLESVACKTIGNGMHYNDGIFKWTGGKSPNQISVEIPVEKPTTDYEKAMLQKPIKYLRVVRKWVKTRYKYYLQFTLDGIAVKKIDEIAHGRVGLDIGPQSLAISSATHVELLRFAERLDINEQKKKRLMQKMDRSRRATNPDNYNEDGTPRRPSKGHKLQWTYSKNYQELAGKVREFERKNAAIRKYEHCCLANRILLYGDEIYIEKMSFKGLQKRASETKIGKNGRYARKKRFGKSLANRAPAMFQTILENKLKQYGGTYNGEINTFSFRASQYDHTSDTYRKCLLSERWKVLSNGERVQRDLYSAFLLMNSNSTLDQCDRKLCQENFEKFKILHDLEIERLKEEKLKNPTIKYLSSFGV